MLDTMPYADLLAIYNAVTEKPVTRFDTRGNGVRRTEALLEARGLTLTEAARLADVVLPNADVFQQAAPTADTAARVALPGGDSDPDRKEPGHEGNPMGDEPGAMTQIEASIVPFVNSFVRELMKPERAPFVAAFLRQLNAGGEAQGGTTKKREGGMTSSQRKIVDLCSRPEGATGRELAEGCGWPSIAARATCQKLADRYRPLCGPDSGAAAVARRETAERAAHRLLLEVDRLREANGSRAPLSAPPCADLSMDGAEDNGPSRERFRITPLFRPLTA